MKTFSPLLGFLLAAVLLSCLGGEAQGAPMPGGLFSKGSIEVVEEGERVAAESSGFFSLSRKSSKAARKAAAKASGADPLKTPERLQAVSHLNSIKFRASH